jgi:hypothetical protein
MKKREIFLLSTTMILLGTIIGFLWSPTKNGVRCGNNSGNTYYGNQDECCEEWDSEADEDEDDMPF